MADTRRFASRGGRSTEPPASRGRGSEPPPERRAVEPEGSKTVLDLPAASAPPGGGSSEESRRTVMMQAPAVAAAYAAGLESAANPAGAQRVAAPAPDSPMASVLAPPQIELVKHELPEDGPADRRLVLVRESDSPRAAAYRVLRHHVLENGRPRVIAVSSARDRDGKSTCAVNLALALAECGRARVLLIDGNLRRPELAGIFRFIPPWCFAEQLASHREQPLLPWGLVHLPKQWLHIAAINPRSESRQLLDAPAFSIAIERLRMAEYDHIVIDCPSVLGSADVNLIQDAADGVLLVVRARTTTSRDLRQAVEQLSPAKILGTALIEI